MAFKTVFKVEISSRKENAKVAESMVLVKDGKDDSNWIDIRQYYNGNCTKFGIRLTSYEFKAAFSTLGLKNGMDFSNYRQLKISVNPKFNWLTDFRLIKANGAESSISLTEVEILKLIESKDLLLSHCVVDKIKNM